MDIKVILFRAWKSNTVRSKTMFCQQDYAASLLFHYRKILRISIFLKLFSLFSLSHSEGQISTLFYWMYWLDLQFEEILNVTMIVSPNKKITSQI